MPILTPSNTEITQNLIKEYIKPLMTKLDKLVDLDEISRNSFSKLPDSIEEVDFCNFLGTLCASKSSLHPDYSLLGGRLIMKGLQQTVGAGSVTFAQNVKKIYSNTVNGRKSTRISKPVYDFIQENEAELEKIINYENDLLNYEYSAITAFMKRGLERVNDELVETPCQMYLRVAVGLNIFVEREKTELEALENEMDFVPNFDKLKNRTNSQILADIKEYYGILSGRKISLPGPILMHAGSEMNQMASCFLEYCGDSLTDDNYHIDGKVGGIMKAMTQLAAQSKGGAGSAISLSAIRSSRSAIMKTNGKSNGVLPFMKMFDATIGAIDQSGKRAGVCTVYIEPWHGDILEFLDAGDHFTIEEKRCKHLFFALWMNDLFFKRMVEDKGDAKWTLFDPAIAKSILGKDLGDIYGEEFEESYLRLEKMGAGKTIPLMEIWSRVCKLLQTTGQPYLLNKDQANLKSNSKNIDTIKSSNVCTEILLPSNEKETAVCVLSSICLKSFAGFDIPGNINGVDYNGIFETVRVAVKNLNNVIDLQYYPTPQTRNASLSRRPIGIGSLGLADVFAILKLDYCSPQAIEINKRIYEVIYFAALIESYHLGKKYGSYLGFSGSPAETGILQYDMWNISQESLFLSSPESINLQFVKEFTEKNKISENVWEGLKNLIKQNGLRNSHLIAIAPTAQASVRMSQTEMHEPFGRNIYIRQTIAGSIQIINKYLVNDLMELGLWSQSLANQIISHDGSVQNIPSIPDNLKSRYQTIYEIDWKTRNQMMADRSAFVDQSSSFNHYVTFQDAGPTAFTQRIIHAWRLGLKTLSYYTHTETATTARKELGGIETVKFQDGTVCNKDNMDCEACQS